LMGGFFADNPYLEKMLRAYMENRIKELREWRIQAGVAQPEERATCNRQGGGSNPPASSPGRLG
jgi:hypothetical protein